MTEATTDGSDFRYGSENGSGDVQDRATRAIDRAAFLAAREAATTARLGVRIAARRRLTGWVR
jgi:hypothetical protein